MTEFFGRFHPLIVHFPISFLLLWAVIDIATVIKKSKPIKRVARVCLFLGALAVVVACATGLALSNPSYDEELLINHKYLGFITAFVSLLALWISNSQRSSFKNFAKSKMALAVPVITLVLISSTGHYGGSLTHGKGFLFAIATTSAGTESVERTIDPNASAYLQLIQPTFENRCYACHSSKKQKGKLRLDTQEYISKGGKGGAIIDQKNPGQSEILLRINLPLEHEDHMPPSDNDQLASSEIDLINGWIETGASFTKKISEFSDSSDVTKFLPTIASRSNTEWWPREQIDKPNPNVISKIVASGATIEKLAAENNYLEVSFISLDSLPFDIWDDLLKIKDHLISFRFSGVSLSVRDLSRLSQFTQLRRLFLDHSFAPDMSLENLEMLNELRYLNLSNNKVGDPNIVHLEKLNKLENLYLFNSSVGVVSVDKLKIALPNCKIETGAFSLPRLLTDTLIYKKK